jgi:hypothetical protein
MCWTGCCRSTSAMGASMVARGPFMPHAVSCHTAYPISRKTIVCFVQHVRENNDLAVSKHTATSIKRGDMMPRIRGNWVFTALSGITNPSFWRTRLDTGEREHHSPRSLPLFSLTSGDARDLLLIAGRMMIGCRCTTSNDSLRR